MSRKVKGQGTITKWFTSNIANRNRQKFASFIGHDNNLKNLAIQSEKKKHIGLSLVSFSSSSDFSEQILSILSFTRYVGIPSSWTVYSDGTHSTEQIELLESSFRFSKVILTNLTNPNSAQFVKHELVTCSSTLLDYASKYPLGKKLFIYLNHDIESPTLFLDSDILFYEKAFVLENILAENLDGWYLPDSDWGCLDSRYIQENNVQLYQINSGVILLNKNLTNLSEGLCFLESIKGEYQYFSEQTVMHILLRANGCFPLDPRIFVLDSSDQFDISYLYDRKELAIRHYSGPVRHKMWQRDWKWHLSLT